VSAVVGLKYRASGFEAVVGILKTDKVVFDQDAWTSLCLHETALMRYYKADNPYLNLLIRDYEVLCLVGTEKAVVFRCLNTYNSVKIKYPEMKRLFELKCLIQMHMDKMSLRARQCDGIMSDIAINILAKQVNTEAKIRQELKNYRTYGRISTELKLLFFNEVVQFSIKMLDSYKAGSNDERC